MKVVTLDIVFQLQEIRWVSDEISVADMFIQPEPILGRWQVLCKAENSVEGLSTGEQAG